MRYFFVALFVLGTIIDVPSTSTADAAICRTQNPAPGTVKRGQRVCVKNAALAASKGCSGDTVIVVGGSNMNMKTGKAKRGSGRKYICAS